jgi:hypothetical protein
MQRRKGDRAQSATLDTTRQPASEPLAGEPREVLKLARALVAEAYGLAHGSHVKAIMGKSGKEARKKRLNVAAGQLFTAGGFLAQLRYDATAAEALRPNSVVKLQKCCASWHEELAQEEFGSRIRSLKVGLQIAAEEGDPREGLRLKVELDHLHKDGKLPPWEVGGEHLGRAKERVHILVVCHKLVKRAEDACRADILKIENYLIARAEKSQRFTRMLLTGAM